MRTVRLHARLLALFLCLLGVGSVLWQVLVQEIPLSDSEVDPVWIVDARIEFQGEDNSPVKLEMYVPSGKGEFVTLSESFVGNKYGINVSTHNGNRLATWSTRRAAGKQVLYYRLVLARRFVVERGPASSPQFRPSEPLEGAERAAAEALLGPIRERSADIQTFVSETIATVNDDTNDSVRLLLAGDRSVEQRTRVVEMLLSAAHVPVEQVHVLRLSGQSVSPEMWLRSFNGESWLYLNPLTAEQGLPEQSIVWWTGSDPLVQVEGASLPRLQFSVHRSEMSTIQMARNVQPLQQRVFWGLSLYDLPLESQKTFRIIMMIPLGVLLILMLRNLVGVETLGTFTPVLVALAFRETDLIWGIFLFTVVTALGLSLRSYLDHLRLQLLPRLSVVLTFVVVVITLISVFGHRLGLERGLSVALFPMVILTMVIERLSIVWEERGGLHSMKVALGTLLAATLAHLLMIRPDLTYFFFTFPGALLVVVSVMLLMGHYRGYRLSELRRFRALTKD
ncbi:MAG: hypothetical protein CVV10_00030 [Gammaproteobacteria bacterium HGW-Gammaproteobacteria-14]|nr:MAG: hypothetical protein CVV10_00030 [Gammaproteobacteria bacterium HGW-Gammaproteobacteria-14]